MRLVCSMWVSNWSVTRQLLSDGFDIQLQTSIITQEQFAQIQGKLDVMLVEMRGYLKTAQASNQQPPASDNQIAQHGSTPSNHHTGSGQTASPFPWAEPSINPWHAIQIHLSNSAINSGNSVNSHNTNSYNNIAFSFSGPTTIRGSPQFTKVDGN